MSILKNKHILITGIANDRSIAYGIAKAMYREGAILAFTYQNNKLKSRVKKAADNCNSKIVLPCNLAKDNSIEKLFTTLSKTWKTLDGFVHSIAYVPKEQLNGNYVNSVTRKGFNIAHDISSYSFVAMTKSCLSMLKPNAALLTITYLGAERVIPNYNVMGLAKASLEANTRYIANAIGPIRVNAISAGPVFTLASSGIKDFKKMLSIYKLNSPIKRLVTIDEIGNTAAFLCSDLSSGITGEVIHVDGGFNITITNNFK